MANNNPFLSGRSVSGDQFVNREDTRESIKKSFESLNNIILMSPRRWGKTSLINKVEDDMCDHKEYVFIKLDAYFSLDEQSFFQKYAEETIKVLKGRFQASLDSFLSHFKNSTIGVSIDPLGKGGLEIGIVSKQNEYSHSDKEHILNLPEKIAEQKNLKVIVCIDEFQQTQLWKSKINILGLLRTVWQQHKNVCYFLYGSHLSMMNYMFNDKSAPFYRFGKVIPLKRIEASTLSQFIVRRVEHAGKIITKEVADFIVECADRNTYYVQDIAKTAFDDSPKKQITQSDITDAVNSIVESLDATFRTLSNGLTANHKKFLKVFARYPKNGSIYTKEFIQESDLGYSSHISKVVTSLIDKGILFETGDDLEFEDPIYKQWIKTRF